MSGGTQARAEGQKGERVTRLSLPPPQLLHKVALTIGITTGKTKESKLHRPCPDHLVIEAAELISNVGMSLLVLPI